MARRSKSAKLNAAPAGPVPADDPSYAPPTVAEADEPSQRKKPRTSRIKGRRGAMSVFSSLPLDLLIDICSNLDPQDLFVLSNTSKVFRAVVTGSSAAVLWTQSRARVGLPELELPMTDLQYAQLLFGKGCSFCARKNAGKPDPYYRARICTACLKDQFADNTTGAGCAALAKCSETPHNTHPLTLLLAKHTIPSVRYGPHYRLAEVEKLDKELHTNFPVMHGGDTWDDRWFVSRRTNEGGRYHPRWLGYNDDKEEVAAPATPFQVWWSKEHEQAQKARAEDGRKLCDWLAAQARTKAMSKDELRQARKEDILRRLRAQGFREDELDYRLCAHQLVRKPELLTDRMWPRVEAPLRELLLSERSTRLAHKLLIQVHLARGRGGADATERPLAVYYPDDSMVSLVPAFRAAVDDVSTYRDPASVWALSKTAILDQLDELARSCIEMMLRSLASVYAECRAARAKGEKDAIVAGLDAAQIDLPRLPSFIPRTADKPLVATDAQLVAFLTEHPLALFTCTGCNGVGSGNWALKHAAAASHTRECTLDAWGLCGQPRDNIFFVDKTTLVRGLHLRDVVDACELVPPAGEVDFEEDAAEFGIDYPVDKKLGKLFVCSCGHNSLSVYPVAEPLGDILNHLGTTTKPGPHSVGVQVKYTRGFVHAISDAKERDMYDELGFRHSYRYDDFDDYDSVDGYDSYGEAYGEDSRVECSIM